MPAPKNEAEIASTGRVKLPDGSWSVPVKRPVPERMAIPPLLGGPVKNRIRQSGKPLMNGLEQNWFDMLCRQWPHCDRPRAQAKKYKIGNNAWYKPDITASLWPHAGGAACETAWECKGPKQMKNVARGILTIKAAAHQWPEVRFILVWRDENGAWQTQHVLP